MPELIVFSGNQEVLYFKHCQLRINAAVKQFEILSPDEDLKINITQVNQKFCRKHNVFCAFSADKEGFALVFSKAKDCVPVFDAFEKMQQSNGMVINNFRATFQQFLKLLRNETSPQLVKIVKNLRESLSDEEKLKYFGAAETTVDEVKSENGFVDLTLDEESIDIKPDLTMDSTNQTFPEISLTLELPGDTSGVGTPMSGQGSERVDVRRSARSSALKRRPYENSEAETPVVKKHKGRPRGISIRGVPRDAKKLTHYKIDKFKRQDGSKSEHITIFDPENKELCYVYYYESKNLYKCLACQKFKHSVFIKLHRSGTNEIFVQYSPREHRCVPQPEALILDSADFKIKKDQCGKIQEMVVFERENREFCYRFYLVGKGHCFRCRGCHSEKKNVRARLYEKENGELYIKVEDHVCTPTLVTEA